MDNVFFVNRDLVSVYKNLRTPHTTIIWNSNVLDGLDEKKGKFMVIYGSTREIYFNVV